MAAGLLYFLASVGNLFLANLVIFRARRARGGLPIALLCITLFLWDISEAAKIVLKDDYWYFIRLIGSSMAPAFLWHFVLVFVRRERAFRRWIILLYGFTAVFTLTTAGALLSPALREFVRGERWNILYLVALFPFLIGSLVLLRSRRLQAARRQARQRVAMAAPGESVVIASSSNLAVVVQFSPAIGRPRVTAKGAAVMGAAIHYRERALPEEIMKLAA